MEPATPLELVPDAQPVTKVEEIELLRLQNLNLRIELLTKDRDAYAQTLVTKYGNGAAAISIEADGTIKTAP